MDNYQQVFHSNLKKSNKPEKINAPTFAYRCIYNKYPNTPIRGSSYTDLKKYKNFYIDSQLDTDNVDKLNNINNIEIRSLCIGHSKDTVTHIIFRPHKQDLSYIKSIVEKLNTKNTKSIYDIGNNGFYRICVATRNWYRPGANNNTLIQWWDEIPNKIKKAVK